MDAKIIAALERAMKKNVAEQIGDNRQYGWGVKESLQAIGAVLKEATGKEQPEVLAAIKPLINPSAFRQTLEKAKRKDGQTVLQKSEKGATEKKVFDLYGE